MAIENMTNPGVIDSGSNIVANLLYFGYWSLGGAVGITVLTVIFNFIYKRRVMHQLKLLTKQNEEVLKNLQSLNRKK